MNSPRTVSHMGLRSVVPCVRSSFPPPLPTMRTVSAAPAAPEGPRLCAEQALQQAFERVHLLRVRLWPGFRLQSRPRFLEVIAHSRRDAFEVRDLLRNSAFVVVHRKVTVVS